MYCSYSIIPCVFIQTASKTCPTCRSPFTRFSFPIARGAESDNKKYKFPSFSKIHRKFPANISNNLSAASSSADTTNLENKLPNSCHPFCFLANFIILRPLCFGCSNLRASSKTTCSHLGDSHFVLKPFRTFLFFWFAYQR